MSNRKLAIVTNSQPAFSETFIQAHLDQLNPVHHFYCEGSVFPNRVDGKNIVSVFFQLYYKVVGYFFADSKWHLEKAFVRKLKRSKINVVLAEYGTVGVSIFRSCQKTKIPLIVHFHGYDISRYDILDQYHEAYKEMFQMAACIIAVSQEMKNDLIDRGCPQEKIMLCNYGPNPIFESISPDYESHRIIGIGRFVDKKAPYYLIMSMKKVVETFPDAHLTIVGTGPLLNMCINLIKQFKLEDSVELVGIKTAHEIKEYFSRSSIFVQHSIKAANGDKEGSPVAILEAGSAGLPVVATKHAGIKDTVVDNHSGYLVDEHDLIDFAEKICNLLRNRDLREKMGSFAKKHIAQNFSMKLHIESIDKSLNKSIVNG